MDAIRPAFLIVALALLATFPAGCRRAAPPAPPPEPPDVEPAATVDAERIVPATFSRLPAPGDDGDLTATISADAFPRGASVTFRPDAACRWSVPEQTVRVGDDPVAITVQGPPALALADGRLDPPLSVMATVAQPGRPADVRRMRLEPTHEQVAVLRQEPRAADVPTAPGPVTIDGRLDEWQAVAMLDLPYQERRSGVARLCWRPDGLYGAFDVADLSVNVPDELQNTFQADGLELWIETDCARALDITRSRRAHKFSFGPDPAAGDGKARCAVIAGPFRETPCRLEAAWRKTERGYTLEFRIPSQWLAPARMQPGTLMGFHYVLFDDAAHAEDTRPYIRGFYRKPYLWGALRLARD